MQQELESLEAMPPEARVGIWMFEWYWKQPGVPDVEKFVADIRKMNGGKVPTARTWFGYTSVHDLRARRQQGEDARRREARQGAGRLRAAADVKLQPNKCYYRAGDHQLMTSAFVGEALSKPAGDPEDLFQVDHVVAGDKTAPPRERHRLQDAVAGLS